MSKTFKGNFYPKNSSKYVGQNSIKYRSSWEHAFMVHLDSHPNVIAWASESIKIPYFNPFLKKNTVYVPDFYILYLDKNGKQIATLIEIKPEHETFMEKAKTKRDQYAVALNTMKWGAAKLWCSQRGLHFQVLTESQLFQGKSK